MNDPGEYLPTERIGVIVYALALGIRLTTAQVADLCGLRYAGAHRMLCKLSRVIPLAYEDGLWYCIPVRPPRR